MELKPCPFCGGTAKIKTHSFFNSKEDCFADHSYGIRCSCCFAESYQFYTTEERAIEAWNRRAEE